MKEIELTRGLKTQISDHRWDDLNRWSWYALDASHGKGTHYYAARTIRINRKEKTILMHRYILEKELGRPLKREEIGDHIDGLTLNNLDENLRLCTQRENMENRHQNKTSQYPGVCWNKRLEKWRSYFYINGKQKELGHFTTEIKAYNRRNEELNKFNKMEHEQKKLGVMF